MIHQYKNNGFNIVMDVNSGSVHVVDPVVYDAIEILAELAGDMAGARPLSESEKAAVREKLSGAYECPEIDERWRTYSFSSTARSFLPQISIRTMCWISRRGRPW